MQPELLDREQAENLAAAIIAVDGVAGLDGGRFGEVAMLFPGERVRGLHITTPRSDDTPRLEINVVADGSTLPNLEQLATDVREVASQYVAIPIDVTVADVA